jgi:hypothetical protein
MSPLLPAVLAVGATLSLGVVVAEAGPCTKQIAEFEKAVRQSATNPDAGPTARQSIGAELGRQPTKKSVKQAEEGAQKTFDQALARAKALDAQGKGAACMRALAEAKRLYDLQ